MASSATFTSTTQRLFSAGLMGGSGVEPAFSKQAPLRDVTGSSHRPSAQDALRFCLEKSTRAQWFKKDGAFDAKIRRRFGALLRRAVIAHENGNLRGL